MHRPLLAATITAAATASLAAARPPSADDFALRTDCKMELWAAEPDIVSPVALTFDAAGRAYVLEMRDYPYGMDGKGQPGGTVRLLEDTNGDGRPDKSTLFAENLRFPTSICAVKDGVLVSAPPDILFLADRDHDGKAEIRETWFTGFTSSVTDSNFNGLRWHIDGRIHGVNGGNGGKVLNPKHPDKFIELAELDFAFDPQTLKFTPTYPTGGGFGLAFDDAGRSFVTHNINHMQMRILPQRILDEVPGGSPLRGTQNISIHGENTRIYPVAEAATRPNHPEQAGYFSSSGGMGYLNHSAWPPNMAHSLFVCDAASGIVHREILSPDGPILKCQRPSDEQTSEFLAGRDPAFRPTGIELGPDGALYIIDMQRDVIEHPDYIPPRIKSKADLRAGADRGRIWRLTPKGGLPKPDTLPALATPEERVTLLSSPNQWTRLTAQRLLIEQPDHKSLPPLHRALSDRSPQSRKSPPLHHLQTLTILQELTSADLKAAATHPSPEVRAAAFSCAARLQTSHRAALPPDAPPSPATLGASNRATLAVLRHDPFPFVRWQFLLHARELALLPPDEMGTAAVHLLQRDGAIPWMRATALRLLGLESARAISLIQNRIRTEEDALHDIARAQQRIAPACDLLSAAASLGPHEFAAVAAGTLEARRLTSAPLPLPVSLADNLQPPILDGLLALEKAGGILVSDKPVLHPLRPDDLIHDRWLTTALQSAATAESPAAKAPWLRLLRHFPFARTAATIFPALHASAPPELQQAALAALRPHKDPAVAARIVKEWPDISPTLRPALAALLVDRKEFRPALADALVSGAIKPGEITLDLEQRRELLRHSGDDIRHKVSRFLTDDEYSNRAALVDQWLPKLPSTGDPAQGKTAFQKLCFQCHRAGGLGHQVGPDLAAQSHRSVEDLLTHILDPDAAINPNYAAFLAETTDGQKHTGILLSSSGSNIVLLQPLAQKVEIPRAKLKSLQSTGHSLMPAGMEAAYTPQEMRDLISFLQQP